MDYNCHYVKKNNDIVVVKPNDQIMSTQVYGVYFIVNKKGPLT